MSRIDGSSAPQQNNQPDEPKEASQKDSDDFSKRMEEDGKKSGKKDEAKLKKQSPEELMRAMQKKSQGMEEQMVGIEARGQMQTGPSEMMPGKVAVQQARGSDNMANDMRQLADRIATTADAAKGTSEVKISLKNDFLPGTDITVKQVNGELKVNIVTNNPDAHQVISAGQEQLLSNLKEKFGEVSVDLQMESNDRDQDDPDGRSRDQRDYEEDEDDS
ncbi:type III secretion HpaP family protein [Endozoicomonadaceae bacterium StTr2]